MDGRMDGWIDETMDGLDGWVGGSVLRIVSCNLNKSKVYRQKEKEFVKRKKKLKGPIGAFEQKAKGKHYPILKKMKDTIIPNRGG